MRIWEFTSYRPYLSERLGGDGARTGLRTKLAAAIPVHTTFVSQVLKGRTDFSLEQAESINEFLGHSEDEGEFFNLLISKDRAGHPKLKKRFEKKLQLMRDERLNIKNRLNSPDSITPKDREKFYSSALYGAIHVLSAIPQFQTLEALAEAVRISKSRARAMIDFMIRLGVLREEGGKIKSGSNHVHLANDSELILKHHTNWRFHTIANLQFLDRDDLHYSGCLSLSVDDAFKIKESILANLKQNVDLISKSKEETAYVMNFDFYKLFA
ncbi:MAG: DUF4423 domain-containing protein [Bdellovibrionaceae bacterium]|nr:DUF4423 domain-containing protein [Bdellovibrio sp.]